MRHVKDATPPYFEIAEGVRVTYLSVYDNDEPLQVLVDDREVGTYDIVASPKMEAMEGFASMLQRVYNKGATNASRAAADAVAEAIEAARGEGYEDGWADGAAG